MIMVSTSFHPKSKSFVTCTPVCAQKCVHNVVHTQAHPALVAAARRNIALNGLSSKVNIGTQMVVCSSSRTFQSGSSLGEALACEDFSKCTQHLPAQML